MFLYRKKKQFQEEIKITYDQLILLFIIGCLGGVLIEGLFCLFAKGHWESHVVSLIGPFNILYGTGVVLFYIGATTMRKRPILVRVLLMTAFATVLELLCGLLMRDCVGMRAWNYEHSFLNYQGLICFSFSFAWGIVAFGFCLFQPLISSKLKAFKGKWVHYVCLVLGIFMVVNTTLTVLSLIRWSERHYNTPARTPLHSFLDHYAPNDWMRDRFIEWEFLDEVDK